MTLPVTPGSSLSLSQIQTEFTGSNPISISEYYANTAYVADATINSTGAEIPRTGQISFSDFSGSKRALYDGTIAGLLVTYYDSGTTGFGNPVGYSEIYGWYNNSGTAPNPTTTIGGKTIATWCNIFHYGYIGFSGGPIYALDSSYSLLQLSGFTSDPGASYFSSARLGSTSKRTYSTYSYAAGIASWTFNSMFTLGSSGTYRGYIYPP